MNTPAGSFPQVPDCRHNASSYMKQQEKFLSIAKKHCIGVLCEVADVIIWCKTCKQAKGCWSFLVLCAEKNYRSVLKNLSILSNCETVMVHIFNWNIFLNDLEKLCNDYNK